MAENPRRNFNDYNALAQFALSNVAPDTRDDRPPLQPMDPERRQWLEEAITSMVEDENSTSTMQVDRSMFINVVEEMKKSTQILKQKAETEDDAANHEKALDNLLEYVDNLDFANDFHKIGGFVILAPTLGSPWPRLRLKTANLVAELVQNNPYCQEAALEFNLISKLLSVMDTDSVPEVRVKALYGVSCLIRQNSMALEDFIAHDGFSYILRAMQSSIEKLRVKSSFLISCLCEQKPNIKDTLCDMGFVEQLIALIQGEHDSSHEHLISALKSLVNNHSISTEECRRPELNLRGTLEERIKILEGHEENLEELQYCKELMDIVFGNKTENLNPVR